MQLMWCSLPAFLAVVAGMVVMGQTISETVQKSDSMEPTYVGVTYHLGEYSESSTESSATLPPLYPTSTPLAHAAGSPVQLTSTTGTPLTTGYLSDTSQDFTASQQASIHLMELSTSPALEAETDASQHTSATNGPEHWATNESGIGTGTPEVTSAVTTIGTGTPEVTSALTTIGTGTPEVTSALTTIGTGTPEVTSALTTIGTGTPEVTSALTTIGTGTPEVTSALTTIGTGTPEVTSALTTIGTGTPEVTSALTTIGTGTPEVTSASTTNGTGTFEVMWTSTAVTNTSAIGGYVHPDVKVQTQSPPTSKITSTKKQTKGFDPVTSAAPTMTATTQGNGSVPLKPTISFVSKIAKATTKGYNQLLTTQAATRKIGLVTQCLITIAILAGVCTIFVICTIVLCIKISSQKQNYRVSQSNGTELICISALLPEEERKLRKKMKPKRLRDFKEISAGQTSDSDDDDLTLHSFVTEH